MKGIFQKKLKKNVMIGKLFNYYYKNSIYKICLQFGLGNWSL